MPDGKLNPLRLAPADAARLLSKAGGEPVAEKEIIAVVDAGAPVDVGGSLNLVHLGAWLLREINAAYRQ